MSSEAFILEVDLEVLINVLTGVEPCLQFLDKNGEFVQITAAQLIENGVTVEALELAERAELEGSTSTEETEYSLPISPNESQMSFMENCKRPTPSPSMYTVEEPEPNSWLNWLREADTADLLNISNSPPESVIETEPIPSCAPPEPTAIEAMHPEELFFDHESCQAQGQTEQKN
ncbi:hypothetical protein TTRE_0000284101 [Trichuris trichiura]|uniref:Uncharacterized protein n=1 Tax=Trichuris trichiura TaxID=36087 RepID=A0A077Z3G0_TRITR|nr:hypothetical protein TTRE_0000284101 [Trichuris trichiura]